MLVALIWVLCLNDVSLYWRKIQEPRSPNVTLIPEELQSPYSADSVLQVFKGWGSHVCIPSGIAEMKHIDQKLAEKYMDTHTQGQHGMPREVCGGLTSRLLGG